ncbi:MAG: hypothetical protein ACTJGT_00475 [Microbacteriaceae bacterium]
MTKKFQLTATAATILLGGSLGFVGLTPAYSVEQGTGAGKTAVNSDRLDPETQAIVDEMTDLATSDTMQMIQDAGLNDLDPRYQGLTVVDVELRGQVRLRFYEEADVANEILAIVDELNETSPLPIIPVPSQADIRKARELGEHFTDGGEDSIAASLGIHGVTGFSLDLFTGEVVVATNDPDSLATVVKKNGKPFVTYDGITIEVVFSDSNPLDGFQLLLGS